jgi:hypothetical protein
VPGATFTECPWPLTDRPGGVQERPHPRGRR